MKYIPGSIWRTPTGLILKVAYQEDDMVFVYYAHHDEQLHPIVTSYMINGSFVSSWVQYIEGSFINKSRFQMILDKTNG